MRDNIKIINANYANISNAYGQAIGTVDNWLDPFETWLLNHKNINVSDITNSTEFYMYLQNFTSYVNTGTGEDYQKWKELIIYDDSNFPTYVKETQFDLNMYQTTNTKNRWPLRNQMYDTLNMYSKGF